MGCRHGFVAFADNFGREWFVHPDSIDAMTITRVDNDRGARYHLDLFVRGIADPLHYGDYHNPDPLFQDFMSDLRGARAERGRS